MKIENHSQQNTSVNEQLHTTNIDIQCNLILAQWLLGILTGNNTQSDTMRHAVSPDQVHQQRLSEYMTIYNSSINKYGVYEDDAHDNIPLTGNISLV